MTTWYVQSAVWPAEWADSLEQLAELRDDWPWMVATQVEAQPACEIIGYFPSREAAQMAGKALLDALYEMRGEVPAEPLMLGEEGESDWEAAYRQHFQPWTWQSMHWVPVWEEGRYTVPAGDQVIWLDPGMAFGTGNHETTRLCLQEIWHLREKARAAGTWGEGWDLIDAGCGSGILALSALALGYEPVYGFDNDPVAVAIAEENTLRQKELPGSPEWAVGDLESGLVGRRAQVVVANILSPVLIRDRKRLIEAVAPGGYLVLSGILIKEAEEVRLAYGPDFPLSTESHMGEWCALVGGPRMVD